MSAWKIIGSVLIAISNIIHIFNIAYEQPFDINLLWVFIGGIFLYLSSDD